MCNSPPAAFGEFHVHSVYQIEKRIYSLFPPFVKHFDDDRLNFLFIKKKKETKWNECEIHRYVPHTRQEPIVQCS